MVNLGEDAMYLIWREDKSINYLRLRVVKSEGWIFNASIGGCVMLILNMQVIIT